MVQSPVPGQPILVQMATRILCASTKKNEVEYPTKKHEGRDAVLLHDDDLPRNKWPLARVIKALPSKDGLVRKVELQITRNGKRIMLERLIHKLTLLVENDEDQVESPPKEPEHQQKTLIIPAITLLLDLLTKN